MSENNTVVALCCPSSFVMITNTAFDLIALVATSWGMGIQVHTINRQTAYIGPSRCEMVEQAKKIKADYIFFVDSDMRIPPLAIVQLLSHRKDIVGANYVRRTEPFAPITKEDINGKPLKYGKEKLANVLDLPTGCLLISMTVFEKLDMPYFATLQHNGSNDYLGEDLYFCRVARAAGIRTYCDLELSLKIGHSGVQDHYINA